MSIFFIIINFFLTDFNQKWYIPQGTYSSAGRVCIGDTDRDSNYEFIFSTYGGSYTIYFYELHLPATWEIDSVTNLAQPLVWDIGDFDLDGLYDIVMQSSWGAPVVGITVFESPDSASYPTQEVWRDTVGFTLVSPICTYDIDQDGLPEIVKVIGDTTDFDIYESIGNNLYSKIFSDTILEGHSPKSTLAFGDFDLDGQNEFVIGYTGGEYSVWECTGNNTYQEIVFQQIPIPDIADCFTVPDADGDGKLEFVLKGEIDVPPEVYPFIFEATDDNTYQIIGSFALTGGDDWYAGGYSAAGDVDGDSIPEIVLEACQNIYIIKSAGNDSFYVWDTLPGQPHGCNVRIADDIDGNGLNEIVISGNNETRIYEWDEGGVEETALRSTPNALGLQVYPNPFKEKIDIRWQIADGNQKISLKIYNSAGQLIYIFPANLCNLHKSVISVCWNGKDDNGRAIPQGVYFLEFETSNIKESVCHKIIKVE